MRFGTIPISLRATLSLALLSLMTLMVASMALGRSTPHQLRAKHRTRLAESVATSCTLLAKHNDVQGIERHLSLVRAQNPEITSVELQRSNGRLIARSGMPDTVSDTDADRHEASTSHHVTIPIHELGTPWGTLHMTFRPESTLGWLHWLMRPIVRFTLTTLILNGIVFHWYIGRIHNDLKPTGALPEHVRATIDTFAEGVAVLDHDHRIVFANEAFAKNVEVETNDLVGQPMNDFQWQLSPEDSNLPWHHENLYRDASQSLTLNTEHGESKTFLVNASPLRDEREKERGTIVSFDDITVMERRREELRIMLAHLQASREELTAKNQELQILATSDPLTGCLNRRTFFELFDKHWQASNRNNTSLSCAMVDIDFFKSINDTYGHQTGDEVLKTVAACLQKHANHGFIASRYGGEEFSFLMPGTDLDGAAEVAENIRRSIAALKFQDFSITTSIGVSSISLGADGPDSLLDEADKCLFVAKRKGRDQVVRWDEVSDDVEVDESQISRTRDADAGGHSSVDTEISHPAVAAVLAALSFRFPQAAQQGALVAEYAAALGRGRLTAQQMYHMEIAALMLNVGKLGLPDAVREAFPDDQATTRIEHQIGLEIIDCGPQNSYLARIIRASRYEYYPSTGDLNQPVVRKEIPLEARILAIALAFVEGMGEERRDGSTCAKVLGQLQLKAGSTFDPRLLDCFAQVLENYQPLHLAIESRTGLVELGENVERLAVAIDTQNQLQILEQLGPLTELAQRCEMTAIQTLAAEILQAIEAQDSLSDLTPILHELLAVCRLTHRSGLTKNPYEPLGSTATCSGEAVTSTP